MPKLMIAKNSKGNNYGLRIIRNVLVPFSYSYRLIGLCEDRGSQRTKKTIAMNWNLFSMYIALALLGVGMVIYAKIEDRKKGK